MALEAVEWDTEAAGCGNLVDIDRDNRAGSRDGFYLMGFGEALEFWCWCFNNGACKTVRISPD